MFHSSIWIPYLRIPSFEEASAGDMWGMERGVIDFDFDVPHGVDKRVIANEALLVLLLFCVLYSTDTICCKNLGT